MRGKKMQTMRSIQSSPFQRQPPHPPPSYSPRQQLSPSQTLVPAGGGGGRWAGHSPCRAASRAREYTRLCSRSHPRHLKGY